MPKRRLLPKAILITLILSVVISSTLFLVFGLPTIFKPNLLKQIQQNGELIIVTRNSPTTYYQGPDGPTGLEYELAKKFAEHLGVKLKIITPDNLEEIFSLLEQHKAHLAAAGLTVTKERMKRVRFGPGYQEITEQLIYNNQNDKPHSIADILNGKLSVVADSSHIESLKKLQKKYPTLHWEAHNDMESEELLQQVNNQEIDYTVADSNEVALNQRFLLELRVAFDISKPRQLAWAFPKSKDSSLYDRAMVFFYNSIKNGDITQLIERNYGHVSKFDYVGSRIYLRHIATRLSKYKKIYQKAAEKHGINWKLLAAMGYQESHWNPRAVSPTGVRGIMMLTLETAAHLGIQNRLDPRSSIMGGARYLASIRDRFSEHIQEPDRTWFALAAYNVGYYHVEDARELARQLGKDPDTWVGIRSTLPLLSKKKWYRKTRYGYARGWEPVKYVENIRHYYDLLDYELTRSKTPRLRENEAASILPPVL